MPLTRNMSYGNLINRGTQTPQTSVNLDPYTYNDRYPGLDEYNYRKLESKIDNLGLTGYDREKAMDEAYVQVLPLVQNQIKNSDRRKYINQAKYEVSQIQDPNARFQANAKLGVTELAQLVKEKYNVDPSANDEAVFNSWIETIPNGGQLLADYMNNGSRELLYKGGLETSPEDTKQKLKDNFWDELWANIKTKANVPVDNMKKRGQRTISDLSENIYRNILKNTVGDKLAGEMGINLDDYIDTVTDKALQPARREETMNYQNEINQRYAAKEQKNLDQDIKNYYDNKGYTKLLKELDLRGFALKAVGDAAQNREMPVVIAASVFQPEIGLGLMATDTYARENQEAYENMLNNGATYDEAEQGAVVVGLINSAVEVGLEKLIGGVETGASDAIRKTFMKNVTEEATKKGLGRILLEGAGTQLKASAEEGLEEIVQQIVQNAAVRTVNENQDLFQGVGQAFEGGFYNPLNLLAGGGNLTSNIKANVSDVRQSMMNGAYNLGETTRSIVDSVSNVGKTITSTPQTVRNNLNSLLNKAYGIDPTLKKNIQDNPYSAEVWQRTQDYIQENGRPEKSNDVAKALIVDVADKVQENLMGKMEEGEEAGRLYRPLEEAGYSVDLTELKDGIDEMLESYGVQINDGKLDFSKTAIDGSEASNIQKIYNWVKDTEAPMGVKEYRTRFRRTLSDMVDFNQNGRDQAGRKVADTQGDKVLKAIRAKANDLAHAQIPEMADLDKTFNEWVEIMDEVSDGLVYKDKAKKGVIRDNITQIIKNLDTPNRRQLANRLEKIMPGITEEVRAINTMPQLIDHYYKPSKAQTWITGAAGGIIGTEIGGPVGGIIGAGVGYGLSKWIDNMKSKEWNSVISQTSKEGTKKMNDIQARIENNERISKQQKAFLENLSKKLKDSKQQKEAEVVKIMSDISSSEGDVVSVLSNAIARLEKIGATEEANDVKGWLEDVQGRLDNEAATVRGIDVGENPTDLTRKDVGANPTDYVATEEVVETPTEETVTETVVENKPRKRRTTKKAESKKSTSKADIREKFEQELANMKNGERLLVTESLNGEEFTDVITKSSNGFNIQDDVGTSFFIKNEELGPNGLLTRDAQLISFENIGKMK